MTVSHEIVGDFSHGGTFDPNGSIGALHGRTIGSLAGTTIAQLHNIQSPEDVSARAMRGIDSDRGRNQIASQSPPLANELIFSLINTDGLYSPDNAGSPLYGNVTVGVPCRWRINVNGTLFPVAHGYFKNVVTNANSKLRQVDVRVLSQLSRLVGITGHSTPLYGDGTQANGLRTDIALGYILDAVGATDLSMRNFDVGQTKLNWFCIRPTDDLFTLALQVWASEGAGSRMFDAADGRTTFKNRIAEVTESASITTQKTFRDTDNNVDPWYRSWVPGSGEPNIINQCILTLARRVPDAVDTAFWSFGDTVVFGGNQTRTFRVLPTTDDPIFSVVALAGPTLGTTGVGTDYTVNSGAITAQSFSRTSGPYVILSMTAGALGASVSALQVRGKLVRIVSTQIVRDEGIDTAASMLKYGHRTLTLAPLPDLDYLVALDMCNSYVARNQVQRPTATIAVPLYTDALATAVLGLEIGNRVAVENVEAGFIRTMWIESIRITADAIPVAYIGCETIYDPGYLLWDVGLWDVAKWAT